jgi:hypothetical protein
MNRSVTVGLMNRSVTVGLAMLAGAALGAAAVEGLHAQAKPPGTAQVLGHVNSRR